MYIIPKVMFAVRFSYPTNRNYNTIGCHPYTNYYVFVDPLVSYYRIFFFIFTVSYHDDDTVLSIL